MRKLFNQLTTDVKMTSRWAGEGETPVKKIAKSKFYYITVDEAFEKLVPYQFNRGKEKPDPARVLEIAKSIATDGYSFLITPVSVFRQGEKLHMLDHHHQVLAMLLANSWGVDLEIPIQEVELNGIPVNVAVQLLNNSSVKWTLSDYIENYYKEGNLNYYRLVQMAKKLDHGFFTKVGKDDDEHPLGRYASALCGKSCQQSLRNGTYQLSEDDMFEQMEFGKEIIDYWKSAGTPKVGPWREGFIIGIAKLKEKFGSAFKPKELKRLLKEPENSAVFNGNIANTYWQKAIAGVLGLPDPTVK